MTLRPFTFNKGVILPRDESPSAYLTLISIAASSFDFDLRKL